MKNHHNFRPRPISRLSSITAGSLLIAGLLLAAVPANAATIFVTNDTGNAAVSNITAGTTITNTSDTGVGIESFSIDPVGAIPEPSTALFGAIGSLVLLRRRNQ